ncbi:MAG: ABC transporter ATP-binding protein [Gemmatimonadota bacterium]|nr:ABC transporter ATP-binding protein [Gemmatimonadota bacterium]
MGEKISGRVRPATESGSGADPSGADGSRHAILTRGLTRDFPGVRALDGLSLSVPRGSIFGFLGRNGAGKTTTIRLLLGLLRPTDGEARVLGFDPVTDSDEIRRRCGVLLEQPGLLERLSAEANLDLYGRIARLPRAVRLARIEELLQRIDLWDRRDEPVRGWSRGMRQRLAIARALIHRPSLIFLDEPTAGLDPVSAADVRDDLLRLASRERVTVFLTTHNLAEAEKLCDQVAIVRDGRLLARGAPDEIGRYEGGRTVRLRGRGFNDNVAALLSDRREIRTIQREEDGVLVTLAEDAEVSDLVTFLVRVGVGIEEVRPVGNTLEDGVLSIFNDQGIGTLEATA